MNPDTFHTLTGTSEGYYQEKGSKFLAFAYPLSDKNDIDIYISHLKESYPDASHHCYAYVIQTNPEAEIIHHANDDGEPAHSAGDPILGQIRSHQLNNVLIVVIRYFGGTKLGISGLIHAYKTAAANALANNSLVTAYFQEKVHLVFDYHATNEVNQVINNYAITVLKATYLEHCDFVLALRATQKEEIMAKLEQINGAIIK